MEGPLKSALKPSAEDGKREARKARFAHPSEAEVAAGSWTADAAEEEAVPPQAVEAVSHATPEMPDHSPRLRGACALLSISDADKVLVLFTKEKYGPNANTLVPPGGGFEPDEGPFYTAGRETSEEVGDVFGNAVLASGLRPPDVIFKGTAVYHVAVDKGMLEAKYKPTQSPSETSMCGWYDIETVVHNDWDREAKAQDQKGVWNTLSRYAMGVVEALISKGSLLVSRGSAPGSKRTHAETSRSSSSKAERSEAPQAVLVDTPKSPTSPRSKAVRPPSKLASCAGLALLSAAALDVTGALPLKGEAPTFDREFMLSDVKSDFVWPQFEQVCLHEHTVSFVTANYTLGKTACSVADRRCTKPPPPGCYHFIGDVRDFVNVYPHPIYRISGHVTCAPAAWSNWVNWKARIESGELLETCQNVLYFLCLGLMAAMEQPPTAVARMIGEPTFKITAEELGGELHKTYWFWTRNLPAVSPTQAKPENVVDMLSRARGGTSEETMLRRSAFEPAVAQSLMNVWATHAPPAGSVPRPASEPCAEHEMWSKQLMHNYSIFSARYAPMLTEQDMGIDASGDFIIVVPVSYVNGNQVVLVPLVNLVFGMVRALDRPIVEQARDVCVFLGGEEPMMACPLKRKGGTDFVFVVPYGIKPTVLVSPTELLEAKAEKADALWCNVADTAVLQCFTYVSAGAMRIAEMRGLTTQTEIKLGSRGLSAPVVRNRASVEWNTAPDASPGEAETERALFLRKDAAVCAEFSAALEAIDGGDGVCRAFAALIKSAADVAGELPLTPQLLPAYSNPCLRMALVPQRPPPLITEWLVRLPPQPVPAGVTALSWCDIVRRYARVFVCDTINKNAKYDLACYKTGSGNGRRAPFLALDDRAACMIAHADGVGSWNAFTVIWERRDDGMYVPMDFNKPYAEHKNLSFLRWLFGNITDLALLSILFEGMRYKAGWPGQPPRQIRIAHNVQSLDERIAGVAKVMLEHIELGITEVTKICRVETEVLSPDDPKGPLLNLPSYVVGVGGVDKSDSPGPDGEKRKVGNSTEPHGEVLARGTPHGEPDGEIITSFNDMTGPSKIPEGYDGPPVPWPDRESKRGTRAAYAAESVMLLMSIISCLPVVGAKDDVRWMFWQFWLAPSEYWLVGGLMILLLDGELWLCATRDCVMTMGVRPASKIACRFIEEFVEASNLELDEYVKHVWLPKQNDELKQLLEERRVKLGAAQARPFFRAPFTDDIFQIYLGAELGAMGVFLFRRQCSRARLRMSSKVGGGTIIDWVGARHVLNGGFGCLAPVKRARAVLECARALANESTLDQLISTNSYLVHVSDVVDLRANTLRGLRGPVTRAERLEAHGDTVITVTGFNAASVYNDVLDQLSSRCAASFMCAIHDAPVNIDGHVRIVCGSDSCKDGVVNPHVCGGAAGYFWRWPIVGEWRDQHITVTEGLGVVFNTLIMPLVFPNVHLVIGTDSDAAVATQLGKGRSPSLQILHQEQRTCATYTLYMWLMRFYQLPGIYNNLYDLGSRDRMREMYLLASAFGITLTEIPVPQEALDLADRVLARIKSAPEVADAAIRAEEKRAKRKASTPIQRASPKVGAAALAACVGPDLCQAVSMATAHTTQLGAYTLSAALLVLVCVLIWTVMPTASVLRPCPDCQDGVLVRACHPCERRRCVVVAAGGGGCGHDTGCTCDVEDEPDEPHVAGSYKYSAWAFVLAYLPRASAAAAVSTLLPGAYTALAAAIVLSIAALVMSRTTLSRMCGTVCAYMKGTPCSCRYGCASKPLRGSPYCDKCGECARWGHWGHSCACHSNCSGSGCGQTMALNSPYRPGTPEKRIPCPLCNESPLVKAHEPAWCGTLFCYQCGIEFWPCACDEPPQPPAQHTVRTRRYSRVNTLGLTPVALMCMPVETKAETFRSALPLEIGPPLLYWLALMALACAVVIWAVTTMRGGWRRALPIVDDEVPSGRYQFECPECHAGNVGKAHDPYHCHLHQCDNKDCEFFSGECTCHLPDFDPELDSFFEGLVFRRGEAQEPPSPTPDTQPLSMGLCLRGGGLMDTSALSDATHNSTRSLFKDLVAEESARNARPAMRLRGGGDAYLAEPDSPPASIGFAVNDVEESSFSLHDAWARDDVLAPTGVASSDHINLLPAWDHMDDVPSWHTSFAVGACHSSTSASQHGETPAAQSQLKEASAALQLGYSQPRAAAILSAGEGSPPATVGLGSRLDGMVQTDMHPSPEAIGQPNGPAAKGTHISFLVQDDPVLALDSPPHVPGSQKAIKHAEISPQPRSARLARRAAVQEQANLMAEDESQYALCPDNPDQLRRIIIESAEVAADGVPIGTRKADETGFKAVMNFCISIGTPVMRPRVNAVFDKGRELLFYALVIIGLAMAIKPGKHSAAKGMTTGKPSTALNYIYAFKRVMADCGRWVPDTMSGVLKALKGLNKRIRATFGQDALIPRRTQPFSLNMLRLMASALRKGLITGWGNALHMAMLTMMCFALSTGTRCDEMAQVVVAQGEAINSDYLRRANFVPYKNGKPLVPNEAAWASLSNGDMIRGHSAPSKCDRDNVAFGAVAQWFRFDDSNPLNFAAAYTMWEINFPCPVDKRDQWPAFSHLGNHVPFTTSLARKMLEKLMLATIGPEEAALRSFHAFRVTIACALMARPEYKTNPAAQEALIQLMVRWKTPESVRVYARMLPTDYADHVDSITNTDGHPLRGMADSVTIDPATGYDDISNCIAELESLSVKRARKQTAAESDDFVPPTTKDKSGAVSPIEELKRPALMMASNDSGLVAGAEKFVAETLTTYDCVGYGHIEFTQTDPKSLTGLMVKIPNNVWPGYEQDRAKTNCQIVGFAKDQRVIGSNMLGAYIVETDGNYYAFSKSFYVFNKLKNSKK